MNECINVLLIEDNPADARLLRELIVETGCKDLHLDHVPRMSSVKEKLNDEHYHVILLDLSLPDAQGLNTVEQICSLTSTVPIIVLTGLEDEDLAIKSVQKGAQDYLIKGKVNGEDLIRSMRYAIERKRAEAHLHFMATHDPLTHLPNRSLFLDRLSHAISLSKRNNLCLAVLFLDLDGFKTVNDTYGHEMGDRLLQAIGERFRKHLRACDTVARLSGDEFAFILENIGNESNAAVVAGKILKNIAQPFILEGQTIHITTSIGISLYPQDGKDAQELLRRADAAMYKAKQCGKNTYQFSTDPFYTNSTNPIPASNAAHSI